jgi:hypothetical protein
LEAPTIEKVREILQNAPRIFVIREGVVLYLAEALTLRLAALGFNIRAVPGDLSGRIALTASIRPGDAVIGLDLTLLTCGTGGCRLQPSSWRGWRRAALAGRTGLNYRIYSEKSLRGASFAVARHEAKQSYAWGGLLRINRSQ